MVLHSRLKSSYTNHTVFIYYGGNVTNFEDLEELKQDFTLHCIPTRFSTPQFITYLILRKKNISFTRVYAVPPTYGIKQNLKMLAHSLLSKLRRKHN